MSTSKGIKAKLTASWMRNAAPQAFAAARRPPSTKPIAATAPKDSQKPADRQAQGSTASTTTKASAITREGTMARPR